MKMLQLLLAGGMLMNGSSLISKDKRVTVNDKQFQVSISQEDIQKKVAELGAQINKDYVGKKPVIIGVLNGAFIFLSDLVRQLDLECEIDFIQIESYGKGMRTSGDIKLIKDITRDLQDRDVIIVEDIIESGLSIKQVRDIISSHNPKSIRIATFLHKNLVQLDFPIDYIGFNIPPEFVIGYGLDYGYSARHLPDLYALV